MRPRLLDLFCCSGGATRGYQRAGFDVIGVDRAACREAHNQSVREYDRNRRGRKVHEREHCGTDAGIAEHGRRKEKMCERCRTVDRAEKAA